MEATAIKYRQRWIQLATEETKIEGLDCHVSPRSQQQMNNEETELAVLALGDLQKLCDFIKFLIF